MKRLIYFAICTFFAGAASAEQPGDLPLRPASKEVMKITSKGLVPPVLTFSELDSTVFFVNATDDSLVTLKVNFGNHDAHCASGNMKFEGGTMRSVKPIGPRDFALMCFPGSGTYDVHVDGVSGRNTPLSGKVIIQ